MNSFRIYLIRALLPNSGDYDYWNARLFDELQKGRARFGFSSFEGANLSKLQTVVRISKWTQLGEQEKDCWANASFMLTVAAGDYLIYFDIPDTDECVIAMATGGYGFSESWNSDPKNGFRHFIPCTFKATLHRNDLWVGNSTAGTLRFTGFWHRIPGTPEFLGFLSDLGCDNGHKKSEEVLSASDQEITRASGNGNGSKPKFNGPTEINPQLELDIPILIRANVDVSRSAPKNIVVNSNYGDGQADHSVNGSLEKVTFFQSAEHFSTEHFERIGLADEITDVTPLAVEELPSNPERGSATSECDYQSPNDQANALQFSDCNLEITENSTEEDSSDVMELGSASNQIKTADQESSSALNGESTPFETAIDQLKKGSEPHDGVEIENSPEVSDEPIKIGRPCTNSADYFEIDNPFVDDLTENTTDAGIHTSGEGIYMSEEMLDEAVEADLLDTTEPMNMESIVLDDEVLAADLLDSDSGSTSSNSNDKPDPIIPAFPEYRRFAERNPSNHLVWDEESHGLDRQPDFGSGEITDIIAPVISEDLKFNDPLVHVENLRDDGETRDQDACKGRSIARNYMVIELPVRDLDQNGSEAGRLSDITEKGLQITGLEVKPGEIKRLMIDADGLSDSHSFEVEAECRWSRKELDGTYYAGFQITSVSEGGLVNLRKVIDLLAISQEGFC